MKIMIITINNIVMNIYYYNFLSYYSKINSNLKDKFSPKFELANSC